MERKRTDEDLDRILQESELLRKENNALKELLRQAGIALPLPDSEPQKLIFTSGRLSVNHESPAEVKIALFRSLFRGRDDVYPLRWESKKGKGGFSPACRHEWNRAFCDKPRVKCGQCDNREFIPLTDKTIYEHLVGSHSIGVYPLLKDDTCWFLAADFDKGAWKEDVSAYLETCARLGIPAVLEKSRSGRGGHVWMFFSEPVAASVARKVGCYLMTLTMERRYQIGLDSYDRFFPNQDTLPKGGFGNLIALPLQKDPRKIGNSVFLDKDFQPFSDQWTFLSNIKKISRSEIENIAREAIVAGEVVGVRVSQTSDAAENDPWTLSPSGKLPDKVIYGPLPEQIGAVLANLLYVEKAGLPPALHNQLIRLAAFQNPEFYKNQAMRLPTFDKPRVISCSEDFSEHIGLPRGCKDEVDKLLGNLGVEFVVQDKRTTGKPLKATFNGHLRDSQKAAVKELRKYETGILSAATAFGKTVIAAKMIAVRKRNTLVLVHRRQLMDQWRDRLSAFLEIDKKEIGLIGGGKKKPTGRLDIGILQSLYRTGEVNDLVADYGHVIVDECHHLSAFSFEHIMKKAAAKYVLGLTATPVRKDGHHPIIIMQCGPIRFRVGAKSAARSRPFAHTMLPRITKTKLTSATGQHTIQEIYGFLAADKDRNRMIIEDVAQAVREGRSPLLLTERTDHLEELAALLKDKVKNVIILRGGMNKKQRFAVTKKLDDIDANEERVIVATGRYIGEGFDDARLDTLFLALPISWRGTLQQYAGRLHRMYEGKKEVRIFDYIDVGIPMLARMYDKRLSGYKSIGYSVQKESGQLGF
ncbi:MAG: DEAD/DEAH box helicase family protein [Desulfurivibrionaceae bacterium]